jgi:hypothetical protein
MQWLSVIFVTVRIEIKIASLAIHPAKYESILLIYADGVITQQRGLQSFKTISRRRSQIMMRFSGIDDIELTRECGFNGFGETPVRQGINKKLLKPIIPKMSNCTLHLLPCLKIKSGRQINAKMHSIKVQCLTL